jgi:hypothetical protein
MELSALKVRAPAGIGATQPYPGAHAHFWDRAVSRRAFLVASGATVGAVAAADLLRPVAAFASSTSSLPTPIPNGVMIPGPNGPQLFHLFIPGPSDNLNGSLDSPGGELISVFDFDGVIGVAAIKGQGTATSGENDDDGDGAGDGARQTLFYDVDMRFMSGQFIDRGGKHRQSTFGFV